MEKKIQKERAVAVRRFIQGESPGVICASMGKSRRWLYKWVARHTPDDLAWCEDQSRRPRHPMGGGGHGSAADSLAPYHQSHFMPP